MGLSTNYLSFADGLIGAIPSPPFGEHEGDFAPEESDESKNNQKDAQDYNDLQ
jgi:hypothetical protein